MKTKTTIITLAALSFGIAASQGEQPTTTGSGVVVIVPAADPQHQHADGETLTFNPKNSETSDVWCYKIKGYSITLTTPDNTQHRGTITGRIGDNEPFITVDKPAQRNVENLKIDFTPVMLEDGTDLKIVFEFTNAAALTGTIDLDVAVFQNEPKGADLGAALEAPVYCLADTQPQIKWSIDPTFTGN
jgi:hypothetical protein